MGCCNTLTGISRDCDSNIGGIRRAWIACYDDITDIKIQNNQITAITPAKAWHIFEFRKQTGSITTTFTKDDAVGTLYYESAITLQFTKQETDKRNTFNTLAINDIVTIIEDNNGKYWYFGYDFPVSLTEGTAETGTALSDFNGYNITLTDLSKKLPYQVSYEAMKNIIEGKDPSEPLFVAVGMGLDPGIIFTSPDGINWNQQDFIGSSPLQSIIYGNNLFVAVGTNTLITSSDGKNWKNIEIEGNYDFIGVSYINNQYIAVGHHGTILISKDGEKWELQQIDSEINLLDITYGDGLYIVIGFNNKEGKIFTSTDTKEWIEREFNLTCELDTILYANGIFLAGGANGNVVISSDGIEWTPTNAITYSYLLSAVYAKGLFVAVGSEGLITVSADGFEWTTLNSEFNSNFQGITYGNGLFVGVGNKGTIITSSDGYNWKQSSIGNIPNLDFYSIAYKN